MSVGRFAGSLQLIRRSSRGLIEIGAGRHEAQVLHGSVAAIP